MLYTTDTDVLRLINAFETCILPCAEWTHAAHFTVGLWYALNNTPSEALRAMRTGINRYNPHCGAPTVNDIPRERGYHETLTVFYLDAIYRFCAENGVSKPLHELANILCESEYAAKEFPLRFYSKEVLFSPDARYGYVPPDKAVL
ncbi:MAG: hypothetical protein MUF71_07490 [Candidatus Kapabacteria bacterium]|jgi:hypothetical protein|nr:hypothetical protein [Candidatus Kapabacteria bacterium]